MLCVDFLFEGWLMVSVVMVVLRIVFKRVSRFSSSLFDGLLFSRFFGIVNKFFNLFWRFKVMVLVFLFVVFKLFFVWFWSVSWVLFVFVGVIWAVASCSTSGIDISLWFVFFFLCSIKFIICMVGINFKIFVFFLVNSFVCFKVVRRYFVIEVGSSRW